MNLDIKTIIFLTAISTLIIGVSMFVTSVNYPQIRGIKKWAYACGLQGAGWILMGLRGSIPDLFSIYLGNVLIIFSAAMFFHSIAQFKTEKTYSYFLITLTGIFSAVFGYFTFIEPHFVVRSILTSSAAAVLAVGCAYLLIFAGGKRPIKSEWVMAIGFITIAFAAVIRCIDLAVYFDDEIHDLFAADIGHSAIFTLFFASILILTYSFTLMINDRFMDEIMRLATLDPLTEIYNRGAMETLVKKEIDRAKRYHLPMSFLLLDLDHFKRVNDTFGHQTGDVTLRKIVSAAAEALREHDTIARFGGEEFTVLLPDTDIASAERVAERIRKMVESTKFKSGTSTFSVTVSIGLATLDRETDDFESLVRRADLGLYKAKQTGRNRTVAVRNRESRGRSGEENGSVSFLSDPTFQLPLEWDKDQAD